MVEDHGAVVDHGDVFAGDLLAELAGEQGGVAVDGVAVGGVEDVAHDAAGDLRGEDDGALLRGDAARAEAAERAAGGFAGRWLRASSSRRVVRELEYQ